MEKLTLNSVEITSNEILSEKTPERLCQTELSLTQIRSFVNFCEEKECKNEYGAYEVFITDVPEQDKEKAIDATFLEKTNIEGLSHFSDRSFEHIRYFAKEEKSDDEISSSIYGRLYISPSVENTPVLMQKIVEQHYKNNRDLACKFSRTGARNDRIVIYLTEDFGDEIDMMKEIRKDSPELFTSCNKNKLWCNIEGLDDIYFGAEPPNKAFSYGEDRAIIIGEIFSLKKENLVDIDNDKELDGLFKLECLKREVNPFNFGFYINDDTIRSAANDVLYGYSDEEFRQEEEYLESKALVDDWLEKNARLSDGSWLGDDVPKFNSDDL